MNTNEMNPVVQEGYDAAHSSYTSSDTKRHKIPAFGGVDRFLKLTRRDLPHGRKGCPVYIRQFPDLRKRDGRSRTCR